MDADIEAMTEDKRKDIVAAMVREREGQQVRKAAAEAELEGSEGNRKVFLERTIEDATTQIRNVDKELKRFTKDAKAPAKRTTKAKPKTEER